MALRFSATRILLNVADLLTGSVNPNTIIYDPAPTAGAFYLQTNGVIWVNLPGANGSWTVMGTPLAYRETAISTVLTAADEVLAVVGSAAGVTVTLPAANAVPAGQRFTIKDGSGAAVSQPIAVTPAGADTIDGQASATIQLAFGSLDVISNGAAAWRVI